MVLLNFLTRFAVVAFSSSKEWKSEEWVIPMKVEDMRRDFEGWGESVKEILGLIEKPDIWAL